MNTKTALAHALESPECTLWLGDEKSFNQALQAHKYKLFHPEKAADVLACYDIEDGTSSEDGESEVSYESYLIQVEGNLGIINIQGSMTNEDSWANRYFGVVSYAEITRALTELVESDEIEKILFNMDTGGGDVAGLESATEAVLWAMKYKDVYSINSGNLMSAGYWLMAPTKKINGSKMSETGSIGVLIVHRSIYNMLKEAGIDYTVIKAGKYKAIGHPTQKLSSEDKKILQGKADQLYTFFIEHTITYRAGLTISNVSDWAEGLTFFGEEAVQLGLLDGIATLSSMVEVLDTIDKTATQANNNSTRTGFDTPLNSSKADDMAKNKQTVLRSKTEQAALASGVPEAELSNLPEEKLGTEAEKPGTEAAAAAAEKPGAAAEQGTEATAESGESVALVSFLKTQNAELSTELAELRVKLAQSETQCTTLQADAGGLRTITEASMHHMQLVLRQAPTACAELPSSSIVAQHAAVRKDFEKFLPVGQRSEQMQNEDQGNPQETAHKMGIVQKIPNKA